MGQVDAELLDEELLELLKGQVGEGLKYLGSHLTDTYTPEILLVLRAIVFKLSIWDHSASYGALLQGLRYTDARSSLPSRPPPKPWQKAVYGALTVGGRYAWTKWETHLLTASEDYTSAPSPRLRLANRVTELLNSAHDIASMASFLVFLTNGRYRTLLDRLLRLRLTPTSHAASREVSFEYLNRQLVWHAFTEFLLFLLPLVGIARWRRILSRAYRRTAAFLLPLFRRPSSASRTASPDAEEAAAPTGELGFLPPRTCAICYRDQNPAAGSEAAALAASAAGGGGVVGSAATDITNPYETVPCGCVYCFACVAQCIANEVGKSVGFAAAAEGGADAEGEGELREVEPVPEEEGESPIEVTASMVAEEVQMGLEGSRGLSESLALAETEEWARGGASEDSQSEEYEEEEGGVDEGFGGG